MASDDELSLEDFSLEPLEPLEAASAPAKAPAVFKIDTRGKRERRSHDERRATIRFEEDRRAHKDRRGDANGWALGTDI
jgi:hypothetical protein